LKKFTICLSIAAVATGFLAVKTALTGGAICMPEGRVAVDLDPGFIS